MAKILVIEDDASMLDTLRALLKAERHSVDCVESADEAMEYIRAYEYDVLIVDWEMPGMTGVEFVDKFRAKGGQAPVIMLTAKSAVDDRVTGLDSGADYYLTKPFERKALLAFIRASLRRSPEPESDTIHFGNLQFKPASSDVLCGERTITLSQKEALVLKLFLEHTDRIITHKELEIAGWSGEDVSSGAIRVFLTGLREKLQAIGANMKILSVRGYGYRIEPGS